ncbi:UDP-2,3-diacylglucosamine diphosphatase [Engelhardtia mirabilis]|uniref:UDP-2,3-diacylglucosamine hydrolase n=1 Tax=Engelhardtia mirabilis TaxID=2528011 RepID=A0A518BKE8_9BACT|nr:UDP-2,3-diacylglucosamine hydrolase [Planctomycetes bacterium Pla133]QDV01772.1 UDP-2,3-diacylglucosamine hydrolase [Planctomycetes bacterium Pla86]
MSAAGAQAAADRRPELELSAGTLLIGDLHLDVELDGAARGFADWLGGLPDPPRLIVLGDLFEYWVGDAQARTPGGRAVLEALRARVGAGCAIDVIPGNRDFLLGPRFEQATGARVRSQGLIGVLPGGSRALIVHGDELCTLDVGYQRLRRVLRSRALTWLAPRLPLAISQGLARRLRRASRTALETKPRAEAQQQPDAVRDLCAETRCGVLICGHAHEWRDEQLDGGPRWLVVDAFGAGRDLLQVGGQGEIRGSASRDLPPSP